MQLNLHQIATLSEMGIPVWQLRSVDKVIDEELQQTSADQQAVIAAADIPAASDWVVLPTTLLSDAETRLLTAMLNAIGIDIERVALVDEPQFQSLFEHIPSTKRIFLCGVSLAALTGTEAVQLFQTAAGAVIIETHGLADLLQQPSLKRHAWKALQQFAKFRSESEP